MTIKNLKQLSEQLKNELSNIKHCNISYFSNEKYKYRENEKADTILFSEIIINFFDKDNHQLNFNYTAVIRHYCYRLQEDSHKKYNPDDIEITFYDYKKPYFNKVCKKDNQKQIINLIKAFSKEKSNYLIDLIKLIHRMQ